MDKAARVGIRIADLLDEISVNVWCNLNRKIVNCRAMIANLFHLMIFRELYEYGQQISNM